MPIYVARAQVSSAMHLVIQLARYSDGSRRISAISEASGLDDSNEYQWNDLFQFCGTGRDADGRIQGQLERVGTPSFSSEPKEMGLQDMVTCTQGLFA